MLELGSYKGRSTVCLALVAAHVVSVDTHRGDADTGPTDTLADFRANLQAHGVADRVTSVVGRFGFTDAFFDAIGPVPFDFVFIDGAHDAASVEHDTRLALAVVKQGGVIAWHDLDRVRVQDGLHRAGVIADYEAGTLGWIYV